MIGCRAEWASEKTRKPSTPSSAPCTARRCGRRGSCKSRRSGPHTGSRALRVCSWRTFRRIHSPTSYLCRRAPSLCRFRFPLHGAPSRDVSWVSHALPVLHLADASLAAEWKPAVEDIGVVRKRAGRTFTAALSPHSSWVTSGRHEDRARLPTRHLRAVGVSFPAIRPAGCRMNLWVERRAITIPSGRRIREAAFDTDAPTYAEHFPTVEINNTFYRMPSEKTVEGWSQAAANFKLTLKAPKRITRGRLKDCARPFSDSAMAATALGPKLGTLLFQTPPFLRIDLACIRHLPGGASAGRAGSIRVSPCIVARGCDLRATEGEKSRALRGRHGELPHACRDHRQLRLLPAAR